MRLTVLGASGGYPAPEGACSGYLVEDGETRIACDLGCGTLPRLLSYVGVSDLTALVLSHLHFDHSSDALVLRYAVEKAIAAGRRQAPLPVFAPETPALQRALLDETKAFFITTVADGLAAAVGGVMLRFFAVRHAVETYAVDFTAANGRRLFYTADTGWFDALPSYARGADTLLADAAFSPERDTGDPLPHMTGPQVSRLAREAGVGQLLCTHFFVTDDAEARVRREIDFSPCTVARPREQYEI